MFKKLTIFFTLLLVGFTAFSQELPPKSGTLVTDYTNTLSAGDKQQLENKLVAFDDSTSTQIAVVIIKLRPGDVHFVIDRIYNGPCFVLNLSAIFTCS